MKKHLLVDKFKGYINKADITNVPSGFLVSPSQNVIINDGEKVTSGKGYSLYGAANTALTPIISSYTWNTSTGTTIPLRSYTGELEFYYASAWRRLANGYGSSVAFNFAEWWDNTEKIDELLIVNNDTNMRMWSGAVTTIASVGTNTLTMETGTYASWGAARFLTTGTRQVIIAGVTYTYTGGESTATLTGVTPDPAVAAPAIAAGAVVHQAIRTTATTPASGFNNTIIAVLDNQVYVGDSTKRTVYVSKNTSYTDFTSSSPRVPGDGLTGGITIDSPPVAFVPQEKDMYISGAKSEWYQTAFQLSADLVNESLTIKRLKTAPLQGARAQSCVANIRNDVAIITNEKTLETLGRVTNISTPQSVPLSDPIKLDFDDLDYTIAPHVKYHKNKIHIVFPSSSRYYIYDILKGYWQPPQVKPFRRLEIIDGELYAHSNATPETYLVDDGYNDNTNPIHCIAAFSYRNSGRRDVLKVFDQHYTEGYISSNTVLDVALKYDFGGYTTILEHEIDGGDSTILFQTSADGSLGKSPFGSNPLGSITDSPSGLPKFRVIKEVKKFDHFEYQVVYETNDVDQQWEILAYGANAAFSKNDSVSIKQ